MIKITTSNGHGRFYSDGNITVPSVTTILGPPACPPHIRPDEWIVILCIASLFGTTYGKACEQIARGGEPNIEATEADVDKLARLISAYWEWHLENVKEVLFLETPLINKKLGFGGTPDMIATLYGSDIPAIIDHKCTWNISPHYEEQLTAYSMLTPEFKNYRRIILRARKEDLKKDIVRPPQMKEYKDEKRKADMIDMFKIRLEKYKLNEKLYGGNNGK